MALRHIRSALTKTCHRAQAVDCYPVCPYFRCANLASAGISDLKVNSLQRTQNSLTSVVLRTSSGTNAPSKRIYTVGINLALSDSLLELSIVTM